MFRCLTEVELRSGYGLCGMPWQHHGVSCVSGASGVFANLCAGVSKSLCDADRGPVPFANAVWYINAADNMLSGLRSGLPNLVVSALTGGFECDSVVPSPQTCRAA